MYVRVYSPAGEPFDVTRERADVLILESGWTQSAPTQSTPITATPLITAEPSTRKGSRRRKRTE